MRPGWEPCGYGCGKPWRRWAGTTLLGHASCAASPERKAEILARMEADPRLTFDVMRVELGVSEGTLRGWVRDARAARG